MFGGSPSVLRHLVESFVLGIHFSMRIKGCWLPPVVERMQGITPPRYAKHVTRHAAVVVAVEVAHFGCPEIQ